MCNAHVQRPISNTTNPAADPAPPCYAAAMLTDRDSLLRRLHEQLQLQRLKKRKLMLKDEISWLESRLIPDSIA
jgi:hypothetical protein